MLFLASHRLSVIRNNPWRSVPADTNVCGPTCIIQKRARIVNLSSYMKDSGIGCLDLCTCYCTDVWNVLSRKCFSAAGHWSGAKRVAKMLARLMTFGTAFMPVAFAVPTMTVFLFALLDAGLVASAVVARFGFFATVDHTSLRGALDTGDSTAGSATPRGGARHRRLDGW